MLLIWQLNSALVELCSSQHFTDVLKFFALLMEYHTQEYLLYNYRYPSMPLSRLLFPPTIFEFINSIFARSDPSKELLILIAATNSMRSSASGTLDNIQKEAKPIGYLCLQKTSEKFYSYNGANCEHTILIPARNQDPQNISTPRA